MFLFLQNVDTFNIHVVVDDLSRTRPPRGLALLKPLEGLVAVQRGIAHLNRLHLRHGRALVGPVDEGLHGVGRAVGKGFDAAIQAVAHPALDVQRLGLLGHVPAVADALHAAGAAQVAGDGHWAGVDSRVRGNDETEAGRRDRAVPPGRSGGGLVVVVAVAGGAGGGLQGFQRGNELVDLGQELFAALVRAVGDDA